MGLGVASLDCFTTLWARHGIDFDFVEAWEPTTDPQRFFKTVPAAWISCEPAISREERCQVLVPGTRARYPCQVLVPGTRASRMDQPRTKLQSRRATFAAVSPDHRRTARTSDYVLFKLDIDNIETEQGIVDQLLSPEGAADLAFIDEIFRGTSCANARSRVVPPDRTFDSDACPIGLLYHRTVLPTRLCARVYDVAEWRDRRVVDPMVFQHGV